MNKCLQCGKETDNPKFCSLSCSASYNNRKYPKRGDGKPKHCVNCGKKLEGSQRKYCSHNCQHEYQRKQYIASWLDGKENGMRGRNSISHHIRYYLLELADYKCQRCGWGEVNSFTENIPLEIEHIDGNHKNNKPENLIVLCPNCHSLTATYKGANRGNGREYRYLLK